MEQIRVAVVGGGIYGSYHLKALKQIEKEEKVKLVALADLKEEILEKNKITFNIKIYKDYHEMLNREKLDALSIATPDFLHRKIALEAIDSGLHILVEKPLDISIEGCEEIIEHSQKRNIFVQVDFHKRYDPDHILLEKLIRQGRMGEICYGYAWIEDRIDVPTEWFSWTSKTSPAFFLGVHFYDLFRWFLQSEVKSVYATGRKSKLMNLGIDIYDYIQASVIYGNNVNIFFSNSMILPKDFPSLVNQGLRIIGTEGIWENDTQNRGVEVCLSDQGLIIPNNVFYSEGLDQLGNTIHGGYSVDGLRHFIEAVRHLKKGGLISDFQIWRYPSAKDGLQSTKIALAVHESIKSGKVVYL
ncbi:Gfo/Idh/MocA family oxidoreductase [Candidatus Atribacteria bacterium 1244-E10-H5-B2]|nr:MAG: Gfo/Idh/MocA family oxidoreductase [Candidatus Atribacteria bacterium 1244-E10-H5-B2]